MKPYIICCRSVAHQWLCDHNGHLNTRNYMGFFDDAMQHFFSMLGYQSEPGFGWADVKHEVTYSAEVKPGSLVHVDSAVIRIGNKSITYHQRLLLTDSVEVAAENIATTVLFDQTNRKAVVVPKVIKENARPYTLDKDPRDAPE